jgi:hypothetical protein
VANIDSKDGQFSGQKSAVIPRSAGNRISAPNQYQAHFKFRQDEKLFDVSDSRANVDGEVCYPVLTVRLKNGRWNA